MEFEFGVTAFVLAFLCFCAGAGGAYYGASLFNQQQIDAVCQEVRHEPSYQPVPPLPAVNGVPQNQEVKNMTYADMMPKWLFGPKAGE